MGMDKKPENSKERFGFSERFNTVLRERGYTRAHDPRWTDKRIASLFDVDPVTIHNLRSAKRMPSVETGIKLAVWLKVSFEWLMTGRGSKEILPESRLDALPTPVRNVIFELIDQPDHIHKGFVRAYELLRSAYDQGRGETGRSRKQQ